MIRAGLILILVLVALPASAEVFTYVDAQGNRVYTDQPRANAKRVPCLLYTSPSPRDS